MSTVPYEDDPYADPTDNITPLHPHANPQAETSLVAAVLAEPTQAATLLDHVDAGDFYEPRHELVWEAITAVVADGLIPDGAALVEQLRKTSPTALARARLHDYIGVGAIASQATLYARLVRTAAIARRVDAELIRARQHVAAATGPDQLDEVLGRVMDSVDHSIKVLWSEGPTAVPHHTDLGWLTTGQAPVVDPPVWVRMANGHRLFYAGRVNGIFGDPEAAKTWLAMVGAVEVLTAGGTVAFIDVDHNGPQIIAERLMLLGADPAHLADPARFQLHEPDDGEALRDSVRALVAWKPTYVVLDSIGEMMPMLGIKSVDNDELSGALRTTATALAQTGACVVTIDHLPKSVESRSSGFAIGGTAKKRAIDGAYIHADATVPPAPGHHGKILLRIEKDRPGRLREHARGKFVGTFGIDSTRDGVTVISIDQDSPITESGKFRPTALMQEISRFVEDHDQATFNDISDGVTGKERTVRAAIKCLVEEGFMSTVKGQRNSIRHHVIAHYREAEDDQLNTT